MKFSTENQYQRAIKLFQLHNHVLTTTYTTRFVPGFERRVIDGLTNERVRQNNSRIEMCRLLKDNIQFGATQNNGKQK